MIITIYKFDEKRKKWKITIGTALQFECVQAHTLVLGDHTFSDSHNFVEVTCDLVFCL
jgi:hypothetical protein